MKGVILAAGMASRLRPLTDNLPKCLLEIGDRTILGRILNNLIENSIEDVIIVTGYLSDQIHSFVKIHYPDLKVQFIYNEVYDSTNCIYSLWLTKDHILSDDIILLDSDIIFDSRIVKLLISSQYPDCLALRSSGSMTMEDMKVKIRDDDSIIEISKEIALENAVGESIGIEKFSQPFLYDLFKILDRKIIDNNQVNLFYEAAFQEAIDKNNRIFAVDVGSYRCIEIDTHEDIKEAQSEIIPHLP